MPDYLRITVRYLQASSHGRGDGGEPEWPPSPLRLFQALAAASAARWNERMRVDYAAPALQWLEGLARPDILGPEGRASENPYRLYVPDNVADKVAKSLSRGGDDSIANYRTEKDVRPTHIPEQSALHYLYCLAGADAAAIERFVPVLRAAASSITHLGWGVDQAVGEAAAISVEEADGLEGHRWRPVAVGGSPLRVPGAGTLDDLTRRHAEFLGRLDGGFRPVAPLAGFQVVGYHSATARPAARVIAPSRPFVAFEIRRTVAEQFRHGGSRFRPFAAIRAHVVAGMVRHAAAGAAGMSMAPHEVDSFVLGHGPDKQGQSTSDERLMFLPLPSITPQGVEAIRRVLVVGPAGFDLGPLARHLNGAELTEQKSGRALAALALISNDDSTVGHYVGESQAWSTVTPLVLPGHDDPGGLRLKLRRSEESGSATAASQRGVLARLDARADRLVRRSLSEAGCAPELAATAEVEYRAAGFRPGVELAGRYGSSLKYPRFHVRVRFAAGVRGPLSAGAGRYRGLGVFARERP